MATQKGTSQIAQLLIDRENLMAMAFSQSRLKQTRNSPTGALQRFCMWLKSEDPKGFDLNRVQIGGSSSPYFLSYYNNGMLYRIMRDGRVRMESADATNMMERSYKEFCGIVDMILADELAARFVSVTKGDPQVTMSAAKPLNVDDNGTYRIVGMRIMRQA